MLVDFDDLAHAEGVLLDLDGTLIYEGKPLAGAADLLRHLSDRFVIVTNNAENSPIELSARLTHLGLPVPPEQILLAGTLAVETIAQEYPGARVMLLGGPTLIKMAESLGLKIDHENPEIVLLARDRDFSFERIGQAATAISRGAQLFLANPDLVYPTARGHIIPETGALLAAILACTGPINYRTIGKPDTALLEAGLAKLKCSAQSAVMIGDNPATDGEAAKRLGMKFILVEPKI